MQKKIIIITGGPGTGKTTILNGLKTMGFCCYPEISRAITLEAQKEGIEQLFLQRPLLFSELLLKGRKEQFENALKEPTDLIFIDRGLPDITGYLDYIGTDYSDFFSKPCEENLYTQVFSLPPWEEIYKSDEVRYENFEQASTVHQYIINSYKKFQYTPIEVPRDSVENRIQFILKSIHQES
ncbi:AAA family ATPase [Flavobacterium sp.]|uniref:AAA family ATPase n=1 Tax=Flavobacterium sp. TaxID=239 RepID=UPI003C563267